jgi:small-conductance mechanosensitive channel
MNENSAHTAVPPAPGHGPFQADIQAHAASLASEATTWVQAHSLQIALAAGIGVAAYALLNLVRPWGVKLCRREAGTANWYGIVGSALGKTGQIFMILLSVRLVMAYADAPPRVAGTIATLFTIAVVFQVALWLREIIFGAIELRTRDQHHGGQALVSALGIIRLLVTIALFSVALVLVLGNLGFNVTGLIAGLGVGGIAIGLAAQGIFADLFAALAILFDRPFRIGDSISYDKSSGTVEQIGLKSTRVRGAAGEERIIANRKLLDFEILNTTRRVRNRFKFDFCLGYDTAPELLLKVPTLLRQIVEQEGHTLIHGGLNGFGTNGLTYDLEFESKGSDFQADARDRLGSRILASFRNEGISFACPAQVKISNDTA